MTHSKEEKEQTLVRNNIEKSMDKLHYKSYDNWIKNFALNLNNIWNEPSANNLSHRLNSNFKKRHSAIVIGRGPSLNKHKHLELLSQSDYQGSIVCTDGALIPVLRAGVTPEKFSNFYVVTIEPYSKIKKHYDDEIVEKYGDKINGIFPSIADPEVVNCARKAGIKIHWMHLLFDYGQNKKSFNYISALMVRAKNHSNGLPAIQTGGNAGTSAWFISWQILKNSTVALIGINHGWEEDDPWEKIATHGYEEPNARVSRKDTKIKKLFKKQYNPEFDCNYILDPIFEFYSTTLKEFIARSPEWLTTINATEGGSIFGDRIKCMTLRNFLQKSKI